MKSSKATKAKRRLGLSASTNDDDHESAPAKKEVKNPYLKPSATAASSPASNTKQAAAAVTTIAAKATSTVTPDVDTDKFLVGKRKARDDADADDDDGKPSAARKLVTPHHDVEGPRTRTRTKQQQLLSRKPLKFTSEDVISGTDLYYDSDDEHTNKKSKPEGYVPVHIHSNVDYHRRGDVALNQGTLRAYRFIRNHFHVPKNLENDPKFGALSGSCFEERVIRAYSLGQLEPNSNGARMMKRGSSDGNVMLLVCSYCGDEGHKRDGCSKLL